MKTGIRTIVTAIIAVALVAAFTSGCKDSGVVAPTDSTIRVSANPSTVVIDPNEGEETGSTQLDAIILDASGFPSSGISLVFRTSAGTLASGGAAIETNENGVASDILTLNIAGPTSVTVDAISGNLEGTTTVTVATVGQNIPPTASFFVSPSPHGWVDEEVTFNGSASNDPDGAITCHQWDIDGGARIIQDEGRPTTATHIYTTARQSINVVLRVSDDPDVGVACTQGVLPPGSFNGSDTVTEYEIVQRGGDQRCQTWPVAIIDSVDGIIRRTLPVGVTNVTVDLDGTLSYPQPLSFYTWNCGQNQDSQEEFDGMWPCTYTAGTWYPTLFVTAVEQVGGENVECRSIMVSVEVIITEALEPQP